MVLSCSTLDWRSKKTTQPRKKLNLKLWFDSTYCVPQLRGVRLFTIQGEMFMSIRIQNSDRKIAKTSNATAGITRGRSDLLLVGNKVVAAQKNGNEFRTHCADSTLKQFADSIYAMLNRKASKKINSDIYSLEYGINKMGIRDRLKQIEIMTQRKAGLLVA
jgi:hypothetical protein